MKKQVSVRIHTNGHRTDPVYPVQIDTIGNGGAILTIEEAQQLMVDLAATIKEVNDSREVEAMLSEAQSK